MISVPLANAVGAVVVTYHPDPHALAALLAALTPQVQDVVVVDNASPVPPSLTGSARLLRLEHNTGVARAQNIGAQRLLREGAQYLLLLDQDSVPAPDMVTQLLAAHQAARDAGERVAAAGPLIVDEAGRSEGFVRFRDGRYAAVVPEGDARWIDCDLLIASGSLISRQAWDDVGPMAEELFIDKVDTEWCLRAASRGWRLAGVPAARLQHRLGQRQIRLWFGRWRSLALHQPFRYYYIWRNSLLVRRRPHATAAWKRADARQLLSLLLYFGVLAPGRWARLRMMARGLADGLRAKSGAMPR